MDFITLNESAIIYIQEVLIWQLIKSYRIKIWWIWIIFTGIPTISYSPVWSHPKTPPKIQNHNASIYPNNLTLEGARGHSVSSSASLSARHGSTALGMTTLPVPRSSFLDDSVRRELTMRLTNAENKSDSPSDHINYKKNKKKMAKWINNHKSILDNYDSDQSISEEEDCEGNVHGDWSISLGQTTNKKGRAQLLSELEILRDARGLQHVTGPSHTPQKRDRLFCIQDEVDDKRKLTCLTDRVSACTSDEENISDEEVIMENNMLLARSISPGCGNFPNVNFPVSRISRNDEECAWAAVNREVEELVHVNENAICSSTPAVFSKVSKSGKGVRGKAKPKFSFHLQSHKNVNDNTSMPSNAMSLLEASESIKPITAEQSMSDLLEFFKGGKKEQSNIHVVQDDVSVEENYTNHSMALLLDSFRENSALPQGDARVISRTKERLQLVVKRNIRSLGDRTLDGEKSPDMLDTDSSTSSDEKVSVLQIESSDEKVFHQNLEHIIPESKRKKTMADQFQEAIGAASERDKEIPFTLPTHMGTGLFGKLQHVIQNEKERDISFMKQLQDQACIEASHEGSYFDVKILSRWLEAKLTVCSCMFIQHKEDSQWVDNCHIEPKTGRTYTIMFSSRSCGDIELEVGNLIRIYSPWNEVHVAKKNEIVILSTYFSQINLINECY